MAAEQLLRKRADSSRRRDVGKIDYHARGVVYLPEASRFKALLRLPKAANVGKSINEATKAVEIENLELRDTLPQRPITQ